MRVSQIDQLRVVGYALSNKFKTVGTYGLQPIMLNYYSYKIIMTYINYVRKLIAPPEKNINWSPDDFLWLDYNGRPQKRIGLLLLLLL